MAEDMEIFLEQIIKKTNPEEYIKILEQDREDFAEEINKYKEVLDKIKEYINRTEINSVGTPLAYTEIGKDILELLEEIE